MAYSPRMLGVPPPPSSIGKKVADTWDILQPYVTGPVDAFWRLAQSPAASGFDFTEQNAADALTAGGGPIAAGSVVPKPANALNMGIRAFHGSPHSFDKFDMSKIGTGEGAQAYGHGLYFAENEGVARGYRDHVFADPDATFFKTATGKQIATDQLRSFGAQPDALKLATEDLRASLSSARLKQRVMPSSEADDRVKGLEEAISYLETKVKPGSMYEVNINADPNAFLDWDKPLSEQPEAVRKAIAPLMQKVLPSESSVKVDFERGPIPVSERHGGHVRADKYLVSLKHPTQGTVPGYGDSREEAFKNAMAAFMPDHGAGFYNSLARNLDGGAGQVFGHGSAATSYALREAGIPGIKYLDAGSRAPARLAPQLDSLKAQLADAESKLPTAGRHTAMVLKNQIDDLKRQIAMAEQPGTRNYVVFDDKLIEIVRKYGIAGASAMLGYNLMDGVSKDQAKTLNKADLDYRSSEFYRQGGI